MAQTVVPLPSASVVCTRAELLLHGSTAIHLPAQPLWPTASSLNVPLPAHTTRQAWLVLPGESHSCNAEALQSEELTDRNLRQPLRVADSMKNVPAPAPAIGVNSHFWLSSVMSRPITSGASRPPQGCAAKWDAQVPALPTDPRWYRVPLTGSVNESARSGSRWRASAMQAE